MGELDKQVSPTDEELVELLKRQLRENIWSKEQRDELRANLKSWETKYEALIKEAGRLALKADGVKGAASLKKDHLNRLRSNLHQLIENIVLTRTAFEGEAGYDDMVDMVQTHINLLLVWRGQIEDLMGTGLN